MPAENNLIASKYTRCPRSSSHSSVLSSATSGYHYHLIEASSQERLDLIGEQLKKAGFLAPLQPWEKEKHHNI